MIKGVDLHGLTPTTLSNLNTFVDAVGSPVIITSAYRQGDKGAHGRGLAIDVIVPAFKGRLLDLYLLAEKQSWVGIGVYPAWKVDGVTVGGLHLDLRSGPPARWMGLGSDKNQTYVALDQAQLRKAGVV